MAKSKSISSEQSKDTGLALVLICLIVYSRTAHQWLLGTAIVLLLICMTKPSLFSRVAPLWFGLGEFLGKVTSFLILTFVYVLVVTPMGLLHRSRKGDRLKLWDFKKHQTSAMQKRDHQFTPADIENAF